MSIQQTVNVVRVGFGRLEDGTTWAKLHALSQVSDNEMAFGLSPLEMTVCDSTGAISHDTAKALQRALVEGGIAKGQPVAMNLLCDIKTISKRAQLVVVGIQSKAAA